MKAYLNLLVFLYAHPFNDEMLGGRLLKEQILCIFYFNFTYENELSCVFFTMDWHLMGHRRSGLYLDLQGKIITIKS